MLRKRLIASFLMITPVLVLFYLDTYQNFGFPGLFLLPFCLIVSIVVAGEMSAMLRDRTAGVTPWVVYLGTLLCNIAVILPNIKALNLPDDCPVNRWGWSCVAIAITLGLAFLHELRFYNEERQPVMRIALTMMVVLYAGWLLSFLSTTRLFLPNKWGALAVFSVMFIVKMSDAGAYFVGKQFGKHKLAPVLSPGKTIEGLFGGIAAAMLAAVIVFAFLTPALSPNKSVASWWAIMAYGLTLSIVGVLGDLCESLIKRDMRCKDSSGWLPGLGGIMDTADSVLFAAPAAFLWWTTGLLGG